MKKFDSDLVSDRLIDLRRSNRYTQKFVSESIGINHMTYCNYERKTCYVPIEVIFSLSCLYGVSSDYLLGLTDMLENNSDDCTSEKSSEMRLIKKVEVLYYG